jgi:hypothetical protein
MHLPNTEKTDMKRRIIIGMTLLAITLSPVVMAKNDKGQLPPGLQKKAAKGQQLPPGWQKKLKKGEVLDKAVFDAGVVVKAATSAGSITINVDDRLLRLDPVTRKILDILK